MDTSTQTESFHLLNRADVVIQAGMRESFFQRKRLRAPRTILGTPRQLSEKKKHPRKRGTSNSLAATHLEPQEPRLGVSDQGIDPLDGTGFQEVIQHVREMLHSTEPQPKTTGKPRPPPKSRHLVIEEKLRALDTPKVITRRPRVQSIARVPPGSTLVKEIRKQAERRRKIKDLFDADSDEELPARWWKRLERSVSRPDVNNNA